MSKRYETRAETYKAKRAYVTLGGKNLAETYGMNLVSYSTGVPTPLVKLIDVPGRPGKLDATLALNGKVNYTSRPVTAEFHVRYNPYPDFETLVSTLSALFNGVESKMVFSTDPDWYYKGRFVIDKKKSNPITSTITISCKEAFPYKLEEVTVEDTISSSKYVYCTGKEYNGAPTIYASVAMQVTFSGTTYQLKAGNNIIREIHFNSGSNSLRFLGTGTVRITYERGIQ